MSKKGIFLDFYGTVVEEDDKYIHQICDTVSSSSLIKASASDVGYFWWKEFMSMFTNSYNENFSKQRMLQIQSLENTINYFQADSDAAKLCSILFEHSHNAMMYSDSVEFLRTVSLPVIILSNIDRQDILLAIEKNGINVKDIITSEDVKSYKPRPEMFTLSLKKHKFNTEDVIHIGDSWSADIVGANNVGIDSIWINRKMKEFKSDIQPLGICNNLVEALVHIQ